MLGYSDQVTQKHAAEAGNTWMQYASAARDQTTPAGRAMDTDEPPEARPDSADKLGADSTDNALFDLDPPVRPYDIHLESLRAAATALNKAQDGVRAAEEQLAHVILQGRHAGLSWMKIAETLGISCQNVYQRWAARLREIEDSALPVSEPDDQSEILFDE